MPVAAVTAQGSKVDFGADDTDAVVSRVLSALQATTPRQVFPPRQVSCDIPLPRRTPGCYPGSHSPWGSGPPQRISREASSIAYNTMAYFRGWRRGHEVAQIGRPAQLVTAAAQTADSPVPPPRHAFLRRHGLRSGAAAARLVGLVVRVLPQWERPRYSEEFRAELSSLNGLHQLAYAVCLMLSAPALRRNLRQERRGELTGTE